MSAEGHEAFKELLALLMTADPAPCDVGALAEWADEEARRRAYADWVDAYHDDLGVLLEGTFVVSEPVVSED